MSLLVPDQAGPDEVRSVDPRPSRKAGKISGLYKGPIPLMREAGRAWKSHGPL